jgi:hypothetical protein
VRRCALTFLFIATSLALPAQSALARSVHSSNWSGYAVHRSGVTFRRVKAVWTEPTVSCIAGRPTYSSFWVGIGGYRPTSRALEQIGTEVDCSASGAIRSSVWYELVPSASRNIRLSVSPGDTVAASVLVKGHRVTVSLADLNTRRQFHKTLRARSVDVSSAEWIVEAPAECFGASACQTLPLANFGSATFSLASVQSTSGQTGGIADRLWRWTRIVLAHGGRRYVVSQGGGGAGAEAIPSPLELGGSRFSVAYSQLAIQSSTARRAAVRAEQLLR